MTVDLDVQCSGCGAPLAGDFSVSLDGATGVIGVRPTAGDWPDCSCGDVEAGVNVIIRRIGAVDSGPRL